MHVNTLKLGSHISYLCKRHFRSNFFVISLFIVEDTYLDRYNKLLFIYLYK